MPHPIIPYKTNSNSAFVPSSSTPPSSSSPAPSSPPSVSTPLTTPTGSCAHCGRATCSSSPSSPFGSPTKILQIHDSRPLSVKSFKSLGDMLITDQHFTTRDFAEGEMIFLEVLRFEIGASNIAFVYLEDLHIQLRELSKLGELVSFDVCMDIMDLLYETEETSVLFDSPCSLAASIIVTAYIVSVRKQQWEFPILPWVKFVTSYEEEEIMGIVRKILQHILKPFMQI